MNDQYIIPLFVAGSLLLTLFAFFLITFLVVQKNKQNAYLLEKKQMVFDHQYNILRTKIEEQENAMDQISKELHDNLKSILGFAQMRLGGIAALGVSDEQVIIIDNVDKALEQVIDNVHNISHSLNANFVKNIGLVDTITKELAYIQASKNIGYKIDISGEDYSLSPEKELHVYRIAQEAIQNCIKHAKATNLTFSLDYKPEVFTMTITDNGIGFDKNKIHEMKGLGFINMFQRARYVHGLLEVQSFPQKGSAVILTLNLNNNGVAN